MSNMICKQRLFHNADKSKVVLEGDPKAAFLYAVPGDEIPESAAKLYGLVDGGLPEKKAAKEKKEPAQTKPAAPAGTKPAATAETKPAAAGETKDA